MKEQLFECRSCNTQTDNLMKIAFDPYPCCDDPQWYEMPLWMKKCCDDEDRNMNGGCNNCGDPSL